MPAGGDDDEDDDGGLDLGWLKSLTASIAPRPSGSGVPQAGDSAAAVGRRAGVGLVVVGVVAAVVV